MWLTTSSNLYPNLYTMLIGHPGTGKTRTIRKAREYMLSLPDFNMGPTSCTAAALVDVLLKAKRFIVQLPDPPLEYNSLTLACDEVGAFMHKYDNEMTAILSAFYDPDPYGQKRRGNDIDIKIKAPQINILAGSTPSNLMELMPEGAWTQGFSSRLMLVFSDERIIGDDFAQEKKPLCPDLLHDLAVISAQVGQYKVTTEYRDAVNNWRALGEEPLPNHPKLLHYNTRRRVHLYKLSIIAAIDRSNVPLLTIEDFNRAAGWLFEVEGLMPEIFKAGASGADAKAQDEIYHFLVTAGTKGLPEHRVVNFARERIPAHSVMRALDVMHRSGLIEPYALNAKTGVRQWRARSKLNLDGSEAVGHDPE